MSVDAYLDRVPAPDYDCLDFVREAWHGLYGEHRFTQDRETLFALRGERLDVPTTPCLVLMESGNQPHVGIYIDGSVLHMTALWTEFQPLAVAIRGHRKVRFYA
jgi:hypothetical protein